VSAISKLATNWCQTPVNSLGVVIARLGFSRHRKLPKLTFVPRRSQLGPTGARHQLTHWGGDCSTRVLQTTQSAQINMCALPVPTWTNWCQTLVNSLGGAIARLGFSRHRKLPKLTFVPRRSQLGPTGARHQLTHWDQLVPDTTRWTNWGTKWCQTPVHDRSQLGPTGARHQLPSLPSLPSLPRCLVGSLARWLVGSLARWLVGSLPRCLVASLPRCLVGSLPRCLVASLTRWGSVYFSPFIRSQRFKSRR
jgi:hypothetical protein